LINSFPISFELRAIGGKKKLDINGFELQEEDASKDGSDFFF
jgi:hypothetical protein